MVLVDIVTGATQGIGKAIALYLATQYVRHSEETTTSNPSLLLVLVGRNQERGVAVVNEIHQLWNQINPHPKSSHTPMMMEAIFESVDLSDYASVLNLRHRIAQRTTTNNNQDEESTDDDDRPPFKVRILVNNAAECPKKQIIIHRPQQQTTNHQIEMVPIDQQFGTNVLGYHFMMKVFEPYYEPHVTHIVNVASNWAGDLDMQDLHFQKYRIYDNDTAYRQSKMADRLLTMAFTERLDKSIIINACHPGDPQTKLSTDLGYNLYGASPSIAMIEHQSPIPFLCGCLSSKPISYRGQWFDGAPYHQPSSCRFRSMKSQAQQLYEICDRFAVVLPPADTCQER